MSLIDNEYVKGFLHTEGTRMVNGDGQQIILTGYGMGNWQNPEGFMIGGPKWPLKELFLGTPHRFDRRRTVTQTVRELCGSNYLQSFWDRWEDNFLGEDDIRAVAETGFNSVRLVLNANSLLEEEPGICFNEKSFSRLERVLDWCEKYRIYAILDMHAAPGGACGCCGDALDNHVAHLFVDDESWERGIVLWEEIAQRFCDRWIVAGYDLLNEPVSLPEEWDSIPQLGRFYDDAIAHIRRVDKNHMIVLEGPHFARGFEIFDHNFDPECNNWCMELHIYDFTPEPKVLYPYLNKSIEDQVPLWIGETCSNTIESAVFFDLCREYGIGYCIWCWKTAMEKPKETNAVGYYLPKEWEKIRTYCAGGPKPSYQKSIEIFDEMLENFRYKNCVHNRAAARLTRKEPDLTIPAVGYDCFLEDGSRYMGQWHFGNYLNFRMEDKTKLVWIEGNAKPFPPFQIYPCENTEPDPFVCLALELSGGEFANYTVHRVKKPCRVCICAGSAKGADIEVLSNKKSVGRFRLESREYATVDAAVIEACEKAVVTVKVLEGTIRMKEISFCYE